METLFGVFFCCLLNFCSRYLDLQTSKVRISMVLLYLDDWREKVKIFYHNITHLFQKRRKKKVADNVYIIYIYIFTNTYIYKPGIPHFNKKDKYNREFPN